MPIRLSDTTFRMYRKRDGQVSFRLHSNLMVLAKSGVGFRLSAYLSDFEAKLTLESGLTIPLDNLTYTDHCVFRMDTMIHEFWASGTADLEAMHKTVGLFQLQYGLFSDLTREPPDILEIVVPVVPMGPRKSWDPKRYIGINSA